MFGVSDVKRLKIPSIEVVNPKCLLNCIPDSLLQPSVGPALFNKEQIGPYEDEGVARYVEVGVQCFPAQYWRGGHK